MKKSSNALISLKQHWWVEAIANGVALVARLGFFPANISPLGSVGFYGRQWPVFLLGIVLFDTLWGGFYRGFWMTYLGFLAYPLAGQLTRHSPRWQLLALPVASLSFFLLSNLGVWWYWYPHTLAGLWLCFTLALPFYTRTLGGDLLFGYGYWLGRYLVSRLSVSQILSRTRLGFYFSPTHK